MRDHGETGLRRAILFGAGYGSLHYVRNSLDRLETALKDHEFRHLEVHADVRSEQLCAALDRFATAVGPDDTVVVIYVGHGGPGHLQPVDHAHRPPGEFRGVLGLELGQHLARLAAPGRNVTLVLDCCHAAGLVADATHLSAEQLARVMAETRERLGGLEAAGRTSPLDHVVQLLAAVDVAMENRADEVGLFSGALADVLQQCRGLEIAWHEVFDEARRRVRAIYRTQFPVLAGPRRILFTTRPAPSSDDFPCAREGADLCIPETTLGRIAVDEQFALRPLGDPRDASDLPRARVIRVETESALLELLPGTSPPATDRPLRAVRVPSAEPIPRLESLRAAVAANPGFDAICYEIRWETFDADGHARDLRIEGACISADDGIRIRLATFNTPEAFRLFFYLFRSDRTGNLVPLCPRRPYGVALELDAHRELTSRSVDPLPAEDDLAWPTDPLPGEHALVCLISNTPLETSRLVPVGRESMVPPRLALEVVRFHVRP